MYTKIAKYFVDTKIIHKFAPCLTQILKTMTLHDLSKMITVNDEQIVNQLRKSEKKGYCVLWYNKNTKSALTATIHNTKKEATAAIKENKELMKWIKKTKIIKL